eukprot:gene8599-biopygen1611
MPAPRPRHARATPASPQAKKNACSPRHARASVLFPLRRRDSPVSAVFLHRFVAVCGACGGFLKFGNSWEWSVHGNPLVETPFFLRWDFKRDPCCKICSTQRGTSQPGHRRRTSDDPVKRTRTGRGPDAGRTIGFEETDADRTRAWPFLPSGA